MPVLHSYSHSILACTCHTGDSLGPRSLLSAPPVICNITLATSIWSGPPEIVHYINLRSNTSPVTYIFRMKAVKMCVIPMPLTDF